MHVKVTRIGDHLAVVLPDQVAARLGAVDGGTLAIEKTAAGIELHPSEDARVAPRTAELLDDIVIRYGETLKILAR